MTDELLVEQEGRVVTVRINRPRRRNALSPGLVRELRELLDGLADDETVGALVLTGDEVAFSSGADLKEPEPPLYAEEINACFNRLERFPKPTVAAISGWCIAGGLELALACDLRVASTESKIGDWHVKINSIGGAGATVRLVRLIGLPRAKELVYTGAAVDGEEAWRIGLVNRVAPPAEYLAAARALAEEIAEQNPVTLAHAKRSLNAAVDLDLHAALDNSLELQEAVQRRLGEDFGAAVFEARKRG